MSSDLTGRNTSIEAFVRANVKRGTTLLTDGHASYPGLTEYQHDPRVVGKMAGHLRRKHVDTYLNEFVFRYNRRFYVSFETLLGLGAHHEPASYWDIVKRDNPRKRAQKRSGVRDRTMRCPSG